MIGLLKWLDNNMEKLLVDEVLTQDYELAKHGFQVIVNPKPPVLKKTEEKEISPIENEKNQEKTENEINNINNNDNVKEQKENKKNNVVGTGTTTEHKGTQLKAEGLKVINVGILECVQLKIVVLCLRCKNQLELDLTHNQTYAKECDKCHNANVVTYRKGNIFRIII